MNRALVAMLCAPVAAAASLSWVVETSGSVERLRGVSVVDRAVAWASGSKGTVVRTIDGGATWAVVPVPGAEALDFRDIEAIDATTAFVLSIGPGDRSRIYRTGDGGKSWTLQFASASPKAFYDAMAFWDADAGLAVGDPVDGRFTVIRTDDGGNTWTAVPRSNLPPALEGEGAFAASGTCLATQGRANAWFATGGAARARVFRSTDRGATWTVADTPLTAGTSSAGAFSIAFADGLRGVVVGGDYRRESESGDNLARTSDGGRTWAFVGSTRLRGFRSAVAYVPGSGGRALVAVGPAGGDVSTDGGATWSSLGDEGFHALAIAGPTDAAWAVGERGRIAKLVGRIVPGHPREVMRWPVVTESAGSQPALAATKVAN